MKAYLADGVYVEPVDEWTIKLTAENGERATDEIYLEQDTLEAFDRWRQARAKGKEEAR